MKGVNIAIADMYPFKPNMTNNGFFSEYRNPQEHGAQLPETKSQATETTEKCLKWA